MKPFCLTNIIVIILSLCTVEIQAQTTQTKLDQVKLIRQFIGTWRFDVGKDTTAILNYTVFGTTIEGDFKTYNKDKIIDSGKELWGYDKKNDKIIMTSIHESYPEINIQVLWFTSNKICTQIFSSEFLSRPQDSPVQAEIEFKSPDLFTITITKNNLTQPLPRVGTVLTMVREPKAINQLHIGKITWTGNMLYTSDTLNEVLGLKTGNNYDQMYIRKRLDDNISPLYMDKGYAWYHADFAENQNINNKVDFTISISEGLIAKIGDITITGKTKIPSDEILNKIVLKSGDLFSKRKIYDSILEIASLLKIDIQKISLNSTRNIEKSTKDWAVIDFTFDISETDKK